jgi:hypothetical protein
MLSFAQIQLILRFSAYVANPSPAERLLNYFARVAITGVACIFTIT